MTTKAPASVIESASDSLEKIAYAVAAEIPVQEPNDANRLGYCLWGWLSEHRGTLKETVRAAGTRSSLDADEIFQQVVAKLTARGVKVSS